MPYPVRKRRDIYGHLIVNGNLYMGPFNATPPRTVMTDRTTGDLTALTTLGALDSQVLTLVTLSGNPPAGTFGPKDGPTLEGYGLLDVKLYVEAGELKGELVPLASGKVSNSPVYAISQIGNYGLAFDVADGWLPGDAFTTLAVEFMP